MSCMVGDDDEVDVDVDVDEACSSLLDQHTWSIHCASRFTEPFPAELGSSSSSFGTAKDATEAWRRHRRQRSGLKKPPPPTSTVPSRQLRQRQRRDNQPINNERNDYDDDGDYVRIKWVGCGNSDGRQRQRHHHQRHLYFEVTAQEEFSAAVLFCFPTFRGGRDAGRSNKRSSDSAVFVSGFEFCFVRGRKLGYEFVLKYVESLTGCVVAASSKSQSFRPHPDELASAVARWTLDSYASQKQKTDGDGRGGSPQQRPLVLTFQVPDIVAGKGLDSLSITIPPAALYQLCRNIQKNRPLTPVTDVCDGHQKKLTKRNGNSVDKKRRRSSKEAKGRRKKKRGTTTEGDDSDSSSDGNNYDHEQEGEDTERGGTHAAPDDGSSLPILRAIQCYVREAFQIDMTHFSLTKASCDAAVFGCDGRCKPHSTHLVASVLDEIMRMVQRRQVPRGK